VCGFDFGKAYGPNLEGFIHVHHLTPLASIRERYRVNPKRDLRPICANCHAVVHRREPPYAIEEVQQMISGVTE
jgi:5-methylcytosine-specific restriction protein A